MEIKAYLNNLKISPRKARLVATLVKGKDVGRVELELRHLPRRSALPLLKLLRSAIANAEHNFQVPAAGLYLKNIFVDPGKTQRRFMPRAFGRASPIRKRTCHVSLVLDSRDGGKFGGRRPEKNRPLIRDVVPGDTLEDTQAKFRKTAEEGKKRPLSEPLGIIRRVFKRKVI